MDSYKILWKHSATKELKRLPKKYIIKILEIIKKLEKSPYPENIKKLQGSESTYRIRAGDYRIIYSIFKSELIIEIIRIRHRKRVYNRLP